MFVFSFEGHMFSSLIKVYLFAASLIPFYYFCQLWTQTGDLQLSNIPNNVLWLLFATQLKKKLYMLPQLGLLYKFLHVLLMRITLNSFRILEFLLLIFVSSSKTIYINIYLIYIIYIKPYILSIANKPNQKIKNDRDLFSFNNNNKKEW